MWVKIADTKPFKNHPILSVDNLVDLKNSVTEKIPVYNNFDFSTIHGYASKFKVEDNALYACIKPRWGAKLPRESTYSIGYSTQLHSFEDVSKIKKPELICISLV